MPFTKSGEYVFDKLDKKVLKIFADLNGKDLKGYPMMRILFPNAKSEAERKQNYATMKNRIDNLSEVGIIKIKYKKDGTPIWEVSEYDICFKRIKMPDGMKNFICAKVDGLWYPLPI